MKKAFIKGTILQFIVLFGLWLVLRGTVPVLEEGSPFVDNALHYINPIPHTLMLTAIVTGMATCGVAFALIITIYHRYGTLEEPELLKRLADDLE